MSGHPMSKYAICALLAPALAAAAAFPWALPEPTFAIPAIDSWSPAPTQAPNVASLELFKRAPDVCGYISGLESSAVSCYDPEYACATNTYYGVHGCCPPESKGLSQCSIPTACIPSSLMSASCTNAKCSSDGYITKCTGASSPECQKWLFVYSTAKPTTMTEWLCGPEATTGTVERTYNGQSFNTPSSSTTSQSETTTESSQTSSSLSGGTTSLPATQPSKPNNTAAIVGGTVGGLVVLGAVAFGIVYLILRDRRHKREEAARQDWINAQTGTVPGVTEYNPHGFPGSPWPDQQEKAWQGQSSPFVSDCGDEGAALGGHGQATLFGVVETAGTQVHEAPT